MAVHVIHEEVLYECLKKFFNNRRQSHALLRLKFTSFALARYKHMISTNGFERPSHEVLYNGNFPRTFAWGATTYAYQVCQRRLLSNELEKLTFVWY